MDVWEVGGSLPPKRAAPTAIEGAEEALKKPKVDTPPVEPKSKYEPIPLFDFCPCESTNEEWLPKGVGWFMADNRHGKEDAYQHLFITDESIWNRDDYEESLNYEEQRLYLKFYKQLSKEVKEGDSLPDLCARLAVGVKGDLTVLKKNTAIVEYLLNLGEDVRAKDRYELYCRILDEVIMNKIMELKWRVENGMHIDEARGHIKRVCFEVWGPKYGTVARYYMLKMLIADKLHILPEELQGLPEELNITLENVSST